MKSRAIKAIALGLASGGIVVVAMLFLAPAWLDGMVRVVAGYDTAVFVMLLSYWLTIARTDETRTRVLAAAEDPGRNGVFWLTLVAVAVGFIAAFDILGRGPHNRGLPHEATVDLIGFAAVALGWLLIHTIFTFHYAHLYYRDRDRDKESDRGLTFPGDEPPDYRDLAYFSFVIGMTFQVSDVQITARPIRRLVLLHGIISFGYNTAILALVVNVVSSLLQR